MNKEKIVAELDIKETKPNYPDYVSCIKQYDDFLPVSQINMLPAWFHERKASTHNRGISKVFDEYGLNNVLAFIEKTHAASLNDTFWIKNESEQISWKQVSLYDAVFDENFSRFSLTQKDICGPKEHCPELTISGSQPKCFRKEPEKGQYGNDIFIYKRNEYNPFTYKQIFASQISEFMIPEHTVINSPAVLFDTCAVKTNMFTNENIGYRSTFFQGLASDDFDKAIMKMFYDNGYENEIRTYFIVNALTLDSDRHPFNYGFLIDNNTGQILNIAPLFDFSHSFCCIDEKANSETYEYDISSELKEDSFWMSQIKEIVTPEIKEKLKELKDFKFSFRSDNYWTENRTKKYEEIISRTAARILELSD